MTVTANVQPSRVSSCRTADNLKMKCRTLQLFFCLVRLSRHYLPPVADYGEKNESEVRKLLSRHYLPPVADYGEKKENKVRR